ncbi:DNA ligase [Echinococcus granulosus]|uniref:DNA ligase n=1 Tax=Echinococcus granulosus TaxID=6210 RepID=W6V606_ECHGR|nr:DNA ligase [Echinococcus granulosus]EUB61809.1 DNA ligase [Echinococcus granulosus]
MGSPSKSEASNSDCHREILKETSNQDCTDKVVVEETFIGQIEKLSSVKETQRCIDHKDGIHNYEDFDPSKESFDPVKDACWRLNEPVPYIAFAKTLECIEGISSRLKIIEVLSNFYRSVGVLSPKELPICIYMSINRLGPSYEGLELGIGESLLIKALTLTTGNTAHILQVSLGASNIRIKSELNRLGDLGAVAEAIKSRQQTMFKPKPLTLQQVFERLKEVAFMVGNASQTKKVKLIQSLLVACRESEAKYLIRSLQGKLRIGLAEQSVLAALGQAVALTPFHSVQALLADGQPLTANVLNTSLGARGGAEAWKAYCEVVVGHVKQAYAQCPNYEKIVHSLLEDGPDDVHKRCCIIPGIPIRPMLAHPTHGVTEVFKRFDQADFTCEYKYDGERAQVHLLLDGSVRVYSRNQEDTTSKYPDIVNSLVDSVLKNAKLTDEACKLLGSIDTTAHEENSSLTTFILDSEAVAWDVDAAQILPFQVLSTRKRKDVQEEDVKVRVCIYAFDLLYLNGVSLTEQPFRKRRELLRLVFPTLPGKFMLATFLDSSDTDKIARFMDESIKGRPKILRHHYVSGNCEGLMLKTLDRDATYEIAKRSRNWLKLKKDYLEGVGDTLDLVVIGGFHGTGKRTGRYGGFLLACYNPDDEEYQTICKVGTGLKDEDLANLSDFYKDHIIPSAKTYYQYTKNLEPDHWFEPVQVWEVKAADISISPAHKAAAGMADPEKGLSLRFPRFLRVREDKKPEEATTAAQVYEMYRDQEQIKNADKPDEANEEGFY